MMERQVIESRIKIKEKEIQYLEAKLREANGYVAALRDLLGLNSPDDKSMAEQARDIILANGHPVHITKLLSAMGREITRDSRVSLTSALSAYVRRGELFIKVGPNQFGLRELGHRRPAAVAHSRDSGPPDDFGEPGAIPNSEKKTI